MSVKGKRWPLDVGWSVAVVLKEPVSDLGCYVGQVEHVDDLGIRITLADFFVGMFTGYDFYIPWTNMLAAEVVTSAHNLEQWDPGKFQTRHENARKAHAQSVVGRVFEVIKPEGDGSNGSDLRNETE